MYNILFIDDQSEELTAKLNSSVENSNFGFTTALTIVSGLEILHRYSTLYDAILLDVQFPDEDMDGLDALKVIRQKYQEIPVIVLSSEEIPDSEISKAVQSIRLGAYNYLGKKNLTPDQLFTNLQNAIHQAKDRQTNELRQKLSLNNTPTQRELFILKEDDTESGKYYRSFGYELIYVRYSSDSNKNQQYIQGAFDWQKRFLEFISKTYNNRVRLRLRFKHVPGEKTVRIYIGFKLVEFTTEEANNLLSMLTFDVQYLLFEDKNSPYIFEHLEETELSELWDFNSNLKYVKYCEKPTIYKNSEIKEVNKWEEMNQEETILPPLPYAHRKESLGVLLDAMNSFTQPCEITLSFFPSSLQKAESEIIHQLTEQDSLASTENKKIKKEYSDFYQKVIQEQYSGILIYITAGTQERKTFNTLHSLIGETFFGNKEQLTVIPIQGTPRDKYSLSETQDIGRANFYYLLHEAFYMFRLPVFSQKNSTAIPFELENYLNLPNDISHEGILVGQKVLSDDKIPIRIDEEALKRHLYMLGQTGTGKSTLLKTMIFDAASKGHGMCVLDPHGDLYDEVYSTLKNTKRNKDIIFFDMNNINISKRLNIIECESDNQAKMNLLIQDLLDVLSGNFDMKSSGGPIFEMFFRAAILLLHEPFSIIKLGSPDLGNAIRIIENDKLRNELLSKSTNKSVQAAFNRVSEMTGEQTWANFGPYINSKISFFTDNYYLNEMFNAPRSTLDFSNIMNQKKILLVRLDKGKIGRRNLSIVGRVFMSKLLQEVMNRGSIPTNQRTPFYVFIDEFQNFLHKEVADAMAEVRKYNVSLILANQNISQLGNEMADAVLGNAGSLVFFRPSVMDFDFIKHYVEPDFNKENIIKMPNFHAVARLMHNNVPMDPFVFQTVY